MNERRFLRTAVSAAVLILTTAFAMACASAGPSVLTSTPDDVAIEFPKSGDLGDATKLAQEECAKNGRIARFTVVKTAATPTTRVAKFKCVSPDVAAPTEATAPATEAAPPEATKTPDADATSDATPEAATQAEEPATP